MVDDLSTVAGGVFVFGVLLRSLIRVDRISSSSSSSLPSLESPALMLPAAEGSVPDASAHRPSGSIFTCSSEDGVDSRISLTYLASLAPKLP